MGVDRRDVVGPRLSRSIQMGLVEPDRDTDNADNEFADQHAKGSPHEQWTTSKPLYGVERERRRAHVNQVEDQRDQKGVGDGTGRLEEGRRVVEDEVDTSPGENVSLST